MGEWKDSNFKAQHRNGARDYVAGHRCRVQYATGLTGLYETAQIRLFRRGVDAASLDDGSPHAEPIAADQDGQVSVHPVSDTGPAAFSPGTNARTLNTLSGSPFAS